MDPVDYTYQEEIEEMIEVDDYNDYQDEDLDMDLEVSYGCNPEDDRFDYVIGLLQDVVVSDEFNQIQTQFFEHHCNIFSEEDENKLEYIDIFQQYHNVIERYIEERMQGVDMQEFFQQLQTRHNEIDEFLFETLLSFTDFQIFKDMMLSHKNGSDLMISGIQSVIHLDEQEEGDFRPDLELSIRPI